jgi:16S rRNA G966 N2-methylase RsmD
MLMDPPYGFDSGAVLAGADAVLAAAGLLVFEHAGRQQVPEVVGRLVRVRQVASGDSSLTFYSRRT